MKRGDILKIKGSGRAGSNIVRPFQLIIGGGVRVAVADSVKIVWRDQSAGSFVNFQHYVWAWYLLSRAIFAYNALFRPDCQGEVALFNGVQSQIIYELHYSKIE